MIAITIRNAKGQQLPCIITLSDKLILDRIDRENTTDFNNLMASNNFVRLNFGVDAEGDFTFGVKYDHLIFDQSKTAKRIREVDDDKENQAKKRNRNSPAREMLTGKSNAETDIDTIVQSFSIPEKVSPINELEDANMGQTVIENSDEIDNDLLAPSTSQSEEAGMGNGTKSDHINMSSGVNVEEKDKIEKRMMMFPVTKEEIDDFGFGFFKKRLSEQRAEIKTMCHAKRFWLAIKFGTNRNLKKLKMNRKALCDLFGIGFTTLKRYLPKKYKQRSDYRQFNYLSPVEFEHTRQQHFFEKYALNYKDLIERGFFKKMTHV